MPRKGHIAKRDVLVDPIYNSKLVSIILSYYNKFLRKRQALGGIFLGYICIFLTIIP